VERFVATVVLKKSDTSPGSFRAVYTTPPDTPAALPDGRRAMLDGSAPRTLTTIEGNEEFTCIIPTWYPDA
jgi:hypothetical protein